jgi:uncharacterized protein (DUF1501 family)
MTDALSRRSFLGRAGLIGCSLAASPLMTPMTFAQAPWDTRLVVIILRGAMDGLDVVRPMGDPDYQRLRPKLLKNGPGEDLDGFFTLHPALSDLMPLWQAGQLGFAHAVSTPYRDKRSHFDGQDLLEAGTDTLNGGVRDGWLNRMLQEVPGISADTAYAIGNSDVRVLKGAAPVANWSPQSNLRLSSQALRLAETMMELDPEMNAALAEAMNLSQGIDSLAMGNERPQIKGAHNQIARFAAERLRRDARVAAFSLNGWDTHAGQLNTLPRGLKTLSETILLLKAEMGADVWNKTAIMALTEFGRTARENGTVGTDHGTGGLMITAGGAVRGGKVFGDWPGLSEAALYDRRDLMPTRDVRALAAWMMRGLTGIDTATMERHVFPGLDMGSDPKMVL